MFARLGLAATGELMVGALRMTIPRFRWCTPPHGGARTDATKRAPTEHRARGSPSFSSCLAVRFGDLVCRTAARERGGQLRSSSARRRCSRKPGPWSAGRVRGVRSHSRASRSRCAASRSWRAYASRTETPVGIAPKRLYSAVAMSAYLLLVRASDTRYGTLATGWAVRIQYRDSARPRGARSARSAAARDRVPPHGAASSRSRSSRSCSVAPRCNTPRCAVGA